MSKAMTRPFWALDDGMLAKIYLLLSRPILSMPLVFQEPWKTKGGKSLRSSLQRIC